MTWSFIQEPPTRKKLLAHLAELNFRNRSSREKSGEHFDMLIMSLSDNFINDLIDLKPREVLVAGEILPSIARIFYAEDFLFFLKLFSQS